METNQQNSATTNWAENQSGAIMDTIKWFFARFRSDNWDGNSQHTTKTFALTRKDSIISVVASLLVVVWAAIYGMYVMKNYAKMNANIEPLKDLSTYDVAVSDQVKEFANNAKIELVGDLIDASSDVQEKLDGRERFRDSQKNNYETLLQNIYLPSLNVWKDPYTKNFDITVMGQKYLEKDKFQDLYLIQYWSDFIKYVWNDADYNIVDNISIWDIVEMDDSWYFYVPVNVSFTSPNKRSFLLLVNKLSMTSNTTNIALLNEFFFSMIMGINDSKKDEIEELKSKYRYTFSSSTSWDGPSDLWSLEWDQLSGYINKVIWYNLYQWINWEEDSPLVDDDLILATIKKSVSCDSKSDAECLYKFRERYRTLPYLAYKIWMDTSIQLPSSSQRTKWLKEFLQDLPSVIAITNFGFNKYSNASFLNNEEEQYAWSLTFRAYGRSVSSDELNEAASALWKLCFWEWIDGQIKPISPSEALSSVESRMASLWWEEKSSNVVPLIELKWLFDDINNQYGGLTNYNKMIKIFEMWRMMNDANLCGL